MLAIMKQRSSKEGRDKIVADHPCDTEQPSADDSAVHGSTQRDTSAAISCKSKVKSEPLETAAPAMDTRYKEVILDPKVIKSEPSNTSGGGGTAVDFAAVDKVHFSLPKLVQQRLANVLERRRNSSETFSSVCSNATGGGGVIINTACSRSDGGTAQLGIRIKPETSLTNTSSYHNRQLEEFSVAGRSSHYPGAADLSEEVDLSDSDEENRGLNGGSGGNGEKKRRKPVPLVTTCPICGNPAPGHNHFGGLCCYSCRAFFRRTSKRPLASFKCRGGENNCVLTAGNKCCIRCRLRKCFKVGMDPSLIKGRRVGRRTGSVSTSSKQDPPPSMSTVSVIRSAGSSTGVADPMSSFPSSSSSVLLSHGAAPGSLVNTPSKMMYPVGLDINQPPPGFCSSSKVGSLSPRGGGGMQLSGWVGGHATGPTATNWNADSLKLRRDQFDLTPPPLISTKHRSDDFVAAVKPSAGYRATFQQRHPYGPKQARGGTEFVPGSSRYGDVPKIVPALSAGYYRRSGLDRSSLDSVSPPAAVRFDGQYDASPPPLRYSGGIGGSSCSSINDPASLRSSPQSYDGVAESRVNDDDIPLDLTLAPKMASSAHVLGQRALEDGPENQGNSSHMQRVGMPRLFFKSH